MSHRTLETAKNFYPYQSWLKDELKVSKLKSPQKVVSPKNTQDGKFLSKVVSTKVSDTRKTDNPFDFLRQDNPSRNLDGISLTSREDLNTSMTSGD